MTGYRTRDEILLDYRAHHPLLDAYMAVVDDHTKLTNINDTAEGIDTRVATALALQRLGRPHRDDLDVECAYAHIRALQEEAATLFPPEDKTLAYFVISGLFPLIGSVPTAEQWEQDTDDERLVAIGDVMDQIGDHSDDLRSLLREALKHAMPAILREITQNQQNNLRLLRSAD